MYAARSLAALVLCATALSACTDDDPDPGPSGDPAGPTTSGTPTTSSKTAAAGELVKGPTFSFHLPAGWEVRDGMTGLWICGPADTSSSELQLVVNWSDIQPYPDLATMAKEARSGYTHLNQQTRVLPETTFGEQPAYHLEGEGTHGPMDEFGVEHAGGTLTVTFEQDRSPAEREELISSVSAGWQWS